MLLGNVSKMRITKCKIIEVEREKEIRERDVGTKRERNLKYVKIHRMEKSGKRRERERAKHETRNKRSTTKMRPNAPEENRLIEDKETPGKPG